VVKGFASASEIQPLIDSLPPLSASIGILNILQPLKAGPSRHVGAALIQKMYSFLTASRFVHQSNAEKLDNAFTVLGGEEKFMALSDIAEALIHKGFKTGGTFSPAALYAVHKALSLDDIGFRPASLVNHVKSSIFQINSTAEVALVKKANTLVRNHYQTSAKKKNGGNWSDTQLEASAFGQFILNARMAIDEGRRCRDWSPHGTLKPSSKPVSVAMPDWSSEDLELIRFMHIWGAMQKFSPKSRHYAIGAMILRALDRYQDSEFLDPQVGWTFLQEIGWLKPWEIQARYKLCLGGVELERGGGVLPPALKPNSRVIQPDVFAGRRKEWVDARVFCIDAEITTDIDDGISLEPTDTPGEYWVHIHVADPASSIRVGSPLANQAALVPMSTYLPGHYSRMFGDHAATDMFSLAAGKRCLTFSAKVDDQGTLLDYKIAPGILRNVTYMTTEEVSAACGEESPSAAPPISVFSVGTPPAAREPPSRPMAKAEELSTEAVDDLRTLSRLGSTLQDNRVKNGAIPRFFSSPRVEVSFDDVSSVRLPKGFMRCSGDPYIKVVLKDNQYTDTVNSMMQLAGEVAARWCHDRGIPIPYRVQPRAAENEHLIRKFTEEVFYPLLKNDQRPSESQWQTLLSLSGGYDISTTVAPNFVMGLDMYTKVTSPLRRYGDLLVHWQIEGALLEEERRGESLVGNKDDSFLPFTRDELEQQVLPMLRVREAHEVKLDKVDGTKEWILHAMLRAWRFGDKVTEGDPLPKTFRYTVNNIFEGRTLSGHLDWYDRVAALDADGLANATLDGMPMVASDVQVGDVFEVELSNIIVSRKRLNVRALRRIGRGYESNGETVTSASAV
jgi:hypothetical protein